MHSLADRCINLWNEYNAGYSLRSRRAFCPLCEPNLKIVSMRKFDRHRCLADEAVVNLKRVPRNFKGTSCTTKKRQTQKVESDLRLPKNAKTTLNFCQRKDLVPSISFATVFQQYVEKEFEQNL